MTNEANPSPVPVADAMVKALEKCRDTFMSYAEMHFTKAQKANNSAEAKAREEKSWRNREMAGLCAAALASQDQAADRIEQLEAELDAARVREQVFLEVYYVLREIDAFTKQEKGAE